MHQKSTIILILSVLLLSSVLSACDQITSVTFTETNTSYQQAEVLLEVILPAALPADTRMQLEVLDDVTGLAYNPTRMDMVQKDALTYYAKTAFSVGSVVKYRYLKTNQNSTVEYTSQGNPVRFRVLKVNGPLVLYDNIAAWGDEPYQGDLGEIKGQLTDATDNTPLPNLLVTVEGIQTLTASDGSFVLEGLTPGTHNLTVIALDGTYEEFQQSALIAANAITPVQVSLTKRPLIEVDFEVQLPTGLDINTGLRLATNFYSLGNMYADIASSVNALAADLPTLQSNSNGIFTLRLSLPAGAYLRYKYTLGDGFWNGELNADGTFRVRELIVPNKNSNLRNIIASFHPESSAPINFKVTVPVETPIEESVSLQLNPYDWTAPLPMTKLDTQTWSFTLYNPQNYFGNVTFRYCRNTNCTLTKEVEPAAGSQIRTIAPSAIAQTIQSSVTSWQLLNPSTGPTTVTTEPPGTSSRPEFLTGFEIDSTLAPLNRSFEDITFGSIATTAANWIILDPSWTVTDTNPPVIEPVPGRDLLWPDILSSTLKAQKSNLSVALFPMLTFPSDNVTFWNSVPMNEGWWQSWFDNYHRFMIQYADAANLSGAAAIIIGDPGVVSTMGNTTLPNGDIPLDAPAQWNQLIHDIRARYNGAIIGAIDTTVAGTELPSWLSNVDAVYLIARPEIASESMASFSTILGAIDAYLETVIKPVATEMNKPILLGLNVRATSDAFLGCNAAGMNCRIEETVAGDVTNLDMETQAKIYNAFIISASGKTWINGFFSRGYNAAGSLQDTSDSVHGKSANDVLWYWYHFLGGKPQ